MPEQLKSPTDFLYAAVIFAAAWAAVAVLVRLIIRYFAGDWKDYKNTESLCDKTFLITGANSGIGFETAKALLIRDARVIFACRNMEKARAAVDELEKYPNQGQLIPMHLDLASFQSIESFVDEVRASVNKIDVIINNAGVCSPLHLDQKTDEGFEFNMGVNHLGHFHLTNLLLEKFRYLNDKPSISRIVIVSSRYHENALLDFNDIYLKSYVEDSKKSILNWNYMGYANSKLMNVYYARALADKLRSGGVDVNACSPGMCYTNIFSTFFVWYQYVLMFPVAFFLMRSARKGAETVIFLATDKDAKGCTGKFFFNCKETITKYKFRKEEERKVWQLSQAMITARKPI